MADAAAGRYRFGAIHLWRRSHAATHRLDEVSKCFLHVRGLTRLVLRPFPVKAQHRNSPSVLYIADLAVTVLVWDHLAAACEINHRAVIAAGVLLEPATIAASGKPFQSAHCVEVRQAAAT